EQAGSITLIVQLSNTLHERKTSAFTFEIDPRSSTRFLFDTAKDFKSSPKIGMSSEVARTERVLGCPQSRESLNWRKTFMKTVHQLSRCRRIDVPSACDHVVRTCGKKGAHEAIRILRRSTSHTCCGAGGQNSQLQVGQS